MLPNHKPDHHQKTNPIKTEPKQIESNFLWAQPGNPCWVETKTKEKFIKAKIISVNNEHFRISVIYDNELQYHELLPQEVDFSEIIRYNEQKAPNPSLGFEDMVNMDVLNEAELLNNLKIRYKIDLIFTYIGPTLIAINPYKPLISDFSSKNIVQYTKQANSQIFNLKENPPHVFAIGAKAFHQLINSSKNQAIVISGESGAGKTENTKFAMRFITSLSSESNEENKLQG